MVRENCSGDARPYIVNVEVVLSGAENECSRQSVFVERLGRKVEFSVANNVNVGQFIKVPLKDGECITFLVASVKKASTTASAVSGKDYDAAVAILKSYKPNGFMRFLASRRFWSLMLIYFGCVGYMLIEDGWYTASAGAAGMAPFFLPLLIAKFVYPLSHLKRYIRKNKLESAIRNDSGYMNVAICAYNALPGKKTLAYIKSLNPKAARKIEQQLAARQAK